MLHWRKGETYVHRTWDWDGGQRNTQFLGYVHTDKGNHLNFEVGIKLFSDQLSGAEQGLTGLNGAEQG